MEIVREVTSKNNFICWVLLKAVPEYVYTYCIQVIVPDQKKIFLKNMLMKSV